MIIIFILTVVTFLMTARSFLIVIGAYKDPILASFQRYGDEQVVSPPVMLIVWVCLFIYVMLFWYISAEIVFVIGLIILIPVGMFHTTVYRLIHEHQDLFRKYPRWYGDLVEMTDRDERRRIAYLWLFLPPTTRMIYNVDNVRFQQWVEQVLLTVAQ